MNKKILAIAVGLLVASPTMALTNPGQEQADLIRAQYQAFIDNMRTQNRDILREQRAAYDAGVKCVINKDTQACISRDQEDLLELTKARSNISSTTTAFDDGVKKIQNPVALVEQVDDDSGLVTKKEVDFKEVNPVYGLSTRSSRSVYEARAEFLKKSNGLIEISSYKGGEQPADSAAGEQAELDLDREKQLFLEGEPLLPSTELSYQDIYHLIDSGQLDGYDQNGHDILAHDIFDDPEVNELILSVLNIEGVIDSALLNSDSGSGTTDPEFVFSEPGGETTYQTIYLYCEILDIASEITYEDVYHIIDTGQLDGMNPSDHNLFINPIFEPESDAYNLVVSVMDENSEIDSTLLESSGTEEAVTCETESEGE